MSSCTYGRLLGGYFIEIGGSLRARSQLCAMLGHEMYHRVTMRREGAHREPWLDEALAHMARQQFLHEMGYGKYALQLEVMRRHATEWFDLSKLRSTRRSLNPIVRARGRIYPAHFGPQVERFAIEIEAAVGPQALSKLVGVESFESWGADLPGELRERLNYLLSRSSRCRNV